MKFTDIFTQLTYKKLNKSIFNNVLFCSFGERLKPLKLSKSVTFAGAFVLTIIGCSYFRNKETKKLPFSDLNYHFKRTFNTSFIFIQKNNFKLFKKNKIGNQFKQTKEINEKSKCIFNNQDQAVSNECLSHNHLIFVSKYKHFFKINKFINSFTGQMMTLSKIYKQNIDKTDVIIDIFHDNFDKIISNTDNKNPLLIMYYERNCLTCFLIRPFINTLAEKLGKVTDIKFARLNIDEIGINIGSPHIFATPTFVMYYGKDNFIKLEEYKPTEIIDLLFREIKTTNKNETEKIYSDLKNQEKKIYVRFQIFILISIWKMYLIEIENISSCEKKSCIRDIIKKSRELQKITTEFLKNLETGFNNEIPLQNINYESQLMKDNELRNSCIEEVFAKGISEDMERSDTLEENINYMKHELKEIIIDYNILIDILEKSNY